mmetsp:Transcript_16517/g.24000  ORF Transcript_16517/g.24000 Transcript_16517/m.24000 type:complete len:116 (+) Transcript_16517:1029-1376(+)
MVLCSASTSIQLVLFRPMTTATPFIQRIINSSVESSIGVSPAQLLFGNAIDLDRGILTPFDAADPDGRPLSVWSSALLNAQRVVMEFASIFLLARLSWFSVMALATSYRLFSKVL